MKGKEAQVPPNLPCSVKGNQKLVKSTTCNERWFRNLLHARAKLGKACRAKLQIVMSFLAVGQEDSYLQLKCSGTLQVTMSATVKNWNTHLPFKKMSEKPAV